MSAVSEGGTRACSADGVEVLVCNVEGRFYGVENRCSHAATRLDGGRLKGHSISCPMHGARFDVRSGAPLAAPARAPIRTFDLVLEGGKINLIKSTERGRPWI